MLYGGSDYFSGYRNEILKIALVETARGVENLDEFAATPGLDMIYLGPNDLGVAYGSSPSYAPNHPRVEAAIDMLVASAGSHSILAGMYAASPEVARLAVAKGYRILSLGYASKIMLSAAAQVLEDTRLR
jgi:4-hydroxy-2-oxoheptanedioate aldolase